MMHPNYMVPLFEQYLASRGLDLEAIVIGGTALSLLGIISRSTRDCDVLDPELPAEILNAAKDFAIDMKQSGHVLQDNWFNNGPSSLTRQLPSGWRERTQCIFNGKGLILHTLGRSDLLLTKLFALCDRGTDLADCIALKPTQEELAQSLDWVQHQDANKLWPEHVTSVFKDLGRRLGHGV